MFEDWIKESLQLKPKKAYRSNICFFCCFGKHPKAICELVGTFTSMRCGSESHFLLYPFTAVKSGCLLRIRLLMHPWSYEKCKWFLGVCFSEILMSFLFCNPDMAMAQKYMTPPTMGLPTPKQDYCHILF